MWVFLVTEVMLFGAIFTAYAIYRFRDPAGFSADSRHLDLIAGATNTVVLIASSFAMALSVSTISHGKIRSTQILLAATGFLGTVFLGIKAYEYSHKIHDGLLPGKSIFYSLYWMMTGIHAIHMIIGLGVMVWMIVFLATHAPLERKRSAVDVAGLYWHFVDVVWVFLFPLLYLVGRHA
jgi:cytochrome c oxidase subunit 3